MPLGVFNNSTTPRKMAPIGTEWTYHRGQHSFWEGVCGGVEAGCVFHDMAIHSAWYIQQFPVRM